MSGQPRKSLTRNQRIDVLWSGNGRCHICGEIINTAREDFEVEHVIPLALGGPDTPLNMRAAHITCHRMKTKADTRQIAKAKRVKAKHEGTYRPSRSPLTHPTLKRKMDGTVVDRATGQPIGRNPR